MCFLERKNRYYLPIEGPGLNSYVDRTRVFIIFFGGIFYLEEEERHRLADSQRFKSWA